MYEHATAPGRHARTGTSSQDTAGRVTAAVRTAAGWPVTDAVLTLIDHRGTQVARVLGDSDGVIATGVLPPGTYTALVAAPGFEPQARMVNVSGVSPAPLGTIVVAHAGGDLPAAGSWRIDPEHSRVSFVAQHLGISGIRGQFTGFGGTLTVAEPVEHSTVTAHIDSASITTGNTVRDTHLRSADFLDVVSHPHLTFEGGEPRAGETGGWRLPGELTIRAVPRPVVLAVRFLGAADDPWGGRRIGFQANTELRRDDFNITFDQRLLTGIALVGATVQVELDIQAVLVEP